MARPDDPSDEPPAPPASEGANRRSADRFDVTWAVDCHTEDTFLYASISNISEMGIFVTTVEPLAIGTRISLGFSPPGMASFALTGVVQWINPLKPLGDNPNPGMGIRFLDLGADDRERIVEAIHTIAYVRPSPTQ